MTVKPSRCTFKCRNNESARIPTAAGSVYIASQIKLVCLATMD